MTDARTEVGDEPGGKVAAQRVAGNGEAGREGAINKPCLHLGFEYQILWIE